MKGSLDQTVLSALLETVPIEFSVLDVNDVVVAWNKHDTRVFRRPESVLGKNVRNCHPKHSLAKVEAIISEMKAGKRDKARFWIDLRVEGGGKRKIMIEYHALRDPSGKYLGCLEATQDVTEIRALEGEKRLLD